MKNQNCFNGICPYYTMFPLDFPKRVLGKSKRGQVVVDPFCGRGTTLYAARQKSLVGYGIDTSPVAIAISRAKLHSVSADELMEAYDSLMEQTGETHIPNGEFWKYAYHKETLSLLCRLRHALISIESVDQQQFLFSGV
jgi:hypothetical protein